MSDSSDPRFAAPGPIHVVAAILRDTRGRILLARRTADRDLAGLWEFPGGKVERGEAPQQALQRELREELGITIGAAQPLIAVPHAYPVKRIVLDVYQVDSFSGRPRGLERQALAWTRPDTLSRYAMPAADRPVVAALTQPDRYLITPEPAADDAAFIAALTEACARGIRRIQLRLRTLAAERVHALAVAVREVTRAHGAELIFNSGNAGGAALARDLGLGLHLTATDLRQTRVRPQGRLAASCHDDAELRAASALDCDFVVLGPVCATASHPGAPGLGWEAFAALRATAALPIYALGGLGESDIALARRHGAQGVAAIRALWPDVLPAQPAGG